MNLGREFADEPRTVFERYLFLLDVAAPDRSAPWAIMLLNPLISVSSALRSMPQALARSPSVSQRSTIFCSTSFAKLPGRSRFSVPRFGSLQIVLANILRNARDAVADNANSCLSPCVFVSLHSQGNYAVLAVEDNGLYVDDTAFERLEHPGRPSPRRERRRFRSRRDCQALPVFLQIRPFVLSRLTRGCVKTEQRRLNKFFACKCLRQRRKEAFFLSKDTYKYLQSGYVRLEFGAGSIGSIEATRRNEILLIALQI